MYGKINVAKVLLTKGANVEAKAEYDGYTPFLFGNFRTNNLIN